MPLVFTFSEYAHTSEALRGLPGLIPGQFSVQRYGNRELHATIEGRVAGERCLILGSIAPPDCQIISVLLLAHTLKKEGASRITGILPYLSYSREDKRKPGQSLATAWSGAVLKASGFDEIWTVDLHSEHDRELFPLPLHSLLPSAVFRENLSKLGLERASFVSPDQGAVPRCEAMKSAAGIRSGGIVYFEKRRTPSGIVHHTPLGKVEGRAVIDDILDTGATLVSACEKLVAAGAQELYICVTHGLFTGEVWHGLWSLPVQRIFCTDTVPACTKIRDPRITVLPVAPVLRDELLRAGFQAETAY